eukprot:jgi/Bigna1/75408/fgenesh1_pg.34_\
MKATAKGTKLLPLEQHGNVACNTANDFSQQISSIHIKSTNHDGTGEYLLDNPPQLQANCDHLIGDPPTVGSSRNTRGFRVSDAKFSRERMKKRLTATNEGGEGGGGEDDDEEEENGATINVREIIETADDLDVILVATAERAVSSIIRLATWSKYDHIMFLRRSRFTGRLSIIEAVGTGVVNYSFTKFLKAWMEGRYFRVGYRRLIYVFDREGERNRGCSREEGSGFFFANDTKSRLRAATRRQEAAAAAKPFPQPPTASNSVFSLTNSSLRSPDPPVEKQLARNVGRSSGGANGVAETRTEGGRGEITSKSSSSSEKHAAGEGAMKASRVHHLNSRVMMSTKASSAAATSTQVFEAREGEKPPSTLERLGLIVGGEDNEEEEEEERGRRRRRRRRRSQNSPAAAVAPGSCCYYPPPCDWTTENSDRSFFCSELVAAAYRAVGILKCNVAEGSFTPGSFAAESCDSWLRPCAQMSKVLSVRFSRESLESWPRTLRYSNERSARNDFCTRSRSKQQPQNMRGDNHCLRVVEMEEEEEEEQEQEEDEKDRTKGSNGGKRRKQDSTIIRRKTNTPSADDDDEVLLLSPPPIFLSLSRQRLGRE